ncbi:hypothetical protein GCM10007916_06440 [Psychromonas marina]|uniref:Uncharacterized protein n=1 Tax=Psychromonas marina TaxID=88364 RepID=A0ABQ6DWY6_9GAMM|nr:hypothetical protein GCM10007916_06440 [Psychromonas marina]
MYLYLMGLLNTFFVVIVISFTLIYTTRFYSKIFCIETIENNIIIAVEVNQTADH